MNNREQLRELVRVQRAGYARFHQLELEKWRAATFADKLEGICVIMGLFRALAMQPPTDDSEIARKRWRKIQERYANRSR